LPRTLAIKKVCQFLAEQIRGNQTMVDDIRAECMRRCQKLQCIDPHTMTSLEMDIERLTKKINFVFDNQGETDADRDEAALHLRELRRQRTQSLAELERLKAIANKPARVPTLEEVEQLLNGLESTLMAAAESGEPEDAAAVRAIIEKMTGGRIVMEQAGERKRFRGWLRGHFHLRIVDALAADLVGLGNSIDSELPEFTIEFRDDTIAGRHANAVKQLYDQGMLISEIADQLNIERHQATDAIRIWHDRHGLPVPVDGRTRRGTVPRSNREPMLFETIAGRVKAMVDSGMEFQAIAKLLGHERTTIRRAYKHWCSQNGESPKDGRWLRHHRNSVEHHQT